MKRNVLKKMMCAVLTAVCVASAVAPVMADDGMVTVEAATKNVTSAYKCHLEGYDKKGYPVSFSKTSFYKDLNALPTVKTGKTTINVPAVTPSVKSVSKKKSDPTYESFVKFKAPKTGKYVVTLTNLRGTDEKSVKTMYYCGFYKFSKTSKKYNLEGIDFDTVGDCDKLFENNYLEKFRAILDNYKTEHPEYEDAIEDTYEDEVHLVNLYSANKIKFTTKLKKGQTYVFVIDNSGSVFPDTPYNDSFYDGSMSCRRNWNYMEAYSFDLDIQLKK